ncbi:two-component system, response regulator YesN [Ruminococcaceae bacterium KH2T8]|nr:two-component system, response regulator YesN [Ruminococcaceae bacterium KH2T8]
MERKLRVMLVDDEPNILKGLRQLIDWESEGYDIVCTAHNGQEAYDFLKENEVDLAIVDVQMPIMTGLELIKLVRAEQISKAEFIILSGFRDFEYAQQAMNLGVSAYLTKPVKASQLEDALHKIIIKNESSADDIDIEEKLRRVYLAQYILALITGKASQKQIDYVKDNMRLDGDLNYVFITLNGIARLDEMTDEEVEDIKKQVRENCESFLGKYSDHFLGESSNSGADYELGFIYCDFMAAEKGMDTAEFFEQLRKHAMFDIPVDIVILIGKKVADITRLAHSYSSASAMKPLRGLHTDKSILIYDEDVHISSHNLAKSMIHKDYLDELITAIVRRDNEAIDSCVDSLMNSAEYNDYKMINMNLNYLLFQLIHRAVEIDEMVEQDNILLYIGDDVFGTDADFSEQLKKFSHEYANYLDQLRENASSGGLIKDIEHEIKSRYAENLTLRDLGSKYFINSSYLGQIFRKKFGMSFKDYLNNYRIGIASEMLLNSDRKVADIAADVGYKDVDYFVGKFFEVHGCTPTKYRRNN